MACDGQSTKVSTVEPPTTTDYLHNTATMSSDDNLFPDSVKDFVFDLHDAARRSFIPSEEQSLYGSSFRELTAKVSFGANHERSGKLHHHEIFVVLSLLHHPTASFIIG